MSRKSVLVQCTNLIQVKKVLKTRNCQPISTSTAKTIEAVEKLLQSDRQLKIQEMATKLDLPKTTVHEIVHDKSNFHYQNRKVMNAVTEYCDGRKMYCVFPRWYFQVTPSLEKCINLNDDYMEKYI